MTSEFYNHLRTLIKKRNAAKMQDPVRYPRVINGYENSMKYKFAAEMTLLNKRLTKKIKSYE